MILQIKGNVLDDKKTKTIKDEKVKIESKPLVASPSVKKEPFTLDHTVDPFVPRAASKPSSHFLVAHTQRKDRSHNADVTTLSDLVALQAKQTELSTLIVDQQRMSSLPAQEPPVFSGNYFDYPTFISAFDAIISRRVASDKDKLYFLNKYTSGKAHDVLKNFLMFNLVNRYQEARRFGNPVRVDEAYKSKLRSWPQIGEGDSNGLQEFSDFLIRCEGAIKSIKYMDELNSTKTLQEIGSKLPSYTSTTVFLHL